MTALDDYRDPGNVYVLDDERRFVPIGIADAAIGELLIENEALANERDDLKNRAVSGLPRLNGDAIGKRVLHRTMWTEREGIVVAETDYELKIRSGFWPFFRYGWYSRVATRVVQP